MFYKKKKNFFTAIGNGFVYVCFGIKLLDLLLYTASEDRVKPLVKEKGDTKKEAKYGQILCGD